MSDIINDDDMIICRCEEITKGEIKEAIRNGASSVTMVKKLTRAGMGLCKGKTCSKLIQSIISQETGIPLKEIDFDVQRAPLRPLKVETIANFKDDDLVSEEVCSRIL
ncbi:MAG: (2Fe-2S)-binding protein [Sedimentibacter sp.]|jgi:NAD(P)H-nitrite reductase large subunit|uniref:(2Fe-2S)-binding protein n=1 Tax=Sedimentibacter sp. TaxID=1960295 RepID=UPI0031594B91